ncbi:45703_t:CDS:2, partial [Gigaspora margarita]
ASEKKLKSLTLSITNMSTSPRADTSTTVAQFRLDKEKEDNDRIVIADSDDMPVLSLHDIVTNNYYENIDYQNKYKESPLLQKYSPTPIQTPPLPRIATPISQCPVPNQSLPIPSVQLLPPPNLLVQLPQASRAAGANPMEQLLQSMNNLILAIETNTYNQP